MTDKIPLCRWHRGISQLFGFDFSALDPVATVGFLGKEAVVGTVGVILGVSNEQLATALHQLFDLRSACSFLTFTLLYTPCVAAVATIKREMRSGWKTLGIVFMQCVVAWIVAWIVYTAGGLLWA